jgi:hypothetical protein
MEAGDTPMLTRIFFATTESVLSSARLKSAASTSIWVVLDEK